MLNLTLNFQAPYMMKQNNMTGELSKNAIYLGDDTGDPSPTG